MARREAERPAREEMVERFLPLARALARRYRGGDEEEDLQQVAAIGLLKAIDRFEPERGVTFMTFAVPTITGELKRHLRDRCWAVHVPRPVKELSLRLERATGELGGAPTVAELAAYSHATPERVLAALHATAARRALSLDQPRPDDSAPDVAVVDPGFAAVEDAEQLDALMRVLTKRDRRILHLRFREDRIQTQIGEQVGLTQMQVSRVVRRSILRLQRAAGDQAEGVRVTLRAGSS